MSPLDKLFDGELLDSIRVAHAANAKYLRGLSVLSAYLQKTAPELSLLLAQSAARLELSSADRRFEVLSSPVFRSAIDSAFVAVFGSRLIETPFSELEDCCRKLMHYGGGSRTSKLAFAIVDPEDPSCAQSRCIIRLFERFLATEVGTTRATILVPPKDVQDRANQAFELLDEISHELTQLVFLHGRYMAYIDVVDPADRLGYREIAQSVSSHLAPSAFFVSYHSSESVELLAEAMVHESLHKKLSNTFYAFPLMIDGAQLTERFHSYWNKDSEWNSNQWEYDRAVYAFHFYAHFVNLYQDSRYRELLGRKNDYKIRQSAERAAALYNWIERTCSSYLTTRGRDFITSLAHRAEIFTWAA